MSCFIEVGSTHSQIYYRREVKSKATRSPPWCTVGVLPESQSVVPSRRLPSFYGKLVVFVSASSPHPFDCGCCTLTFPLPESYSPAESLSVELCTMPWAMDEFAASLPDHVRKNLMSRLCRLAAREPLEAAEAYLNLRPYKERADAGFVYTHLRPNWEVLDNAADAPDDEELDWVDVKVGEAGDMDVRRDYYERDCEDEPILWAYCYQTSYPKLIERLTHLTLRAMGAQRVPYPCRGCAVRHREHFSEAKSGGLEIVAAIIEYWMRRIGEDPVRIPLYA
ncbi:hypothetical protein B0H13DRAFT_1897691 [Mycena leptocephala]|nr:hypothetical protein B0H13DRAFT_1897691 [Mycena leptocephala]